MWDADKGVLTGKYIIFHDYIRKEKGRESMTYVFTFQGQKSRVKQEDTSKDEKLTKNTQWDCPGRPVQGEVALVPGQGLRPHILSGIKIQYSDLLLLLFKKKRKETNTQGSGDEFEIRAETWS